MEEETKRAEGPAGVTVTSCSRPGLDICELSPSQVHQGRHCGCWRPIPPAAQQHRSHAPWALVPARTDKEECQVRCHECSGRSLSPRRRRWRRRVREGGVLSACVLQGCVRPSPACTSVQWGRLLTWAQVRSTHIRVYVHTHARAHAHVAAPWTAGARAHARKGTSRNGI